MALGLIALGGAGEGMAALGKQWTDERIQKELQAARAQQAESLARLTDQLAGAREERMIGVRETVRREGAQADIERETMPENVRRRGEAAASLIRAETPARVERAKSETQARLDIENSPANTAAYIEKLKTLAPIEAKLKSDADIAALLARGTPAALKATHDIAVASRVLTPGQVAEADLAKFKLSQAKLLDTFQQSYADAVTRKDTAAANSIAASMAARFYDPAKAKEDAPLRAAVAVINSMDATPEQKTQAGEFIMSRLTARGEGGGGPKTPKTQAEFDALLPGTEFINPADGKRMIKRGSPSGSKRPDFSAAPDRFALTAEEQRRVDAEPNHAARMRMRNLIIRERTAGPERAARQAKEEKFLAEDVARNPAGGLIGPYRPQLIRP